MTNTQTSSRFDYARVLGLLTGRHIRRLDYVVATFVFSVLVHITTTRGFHASEIGLRLGALLLAHAASVAFLLLVTSRLKQAKLTLRMRAVLLLGFPAVALIRGFVLNFTLVGVGLYEADLATMRAISSLSTTTISYVALALVFGLKAEWSTESARQLANQEQLRSSLSGAADRLERHIKQDVAKVRETLQLKLKALVSKQPQEVADGLRGIMDEVLRPKVAELLAVRDTKLTDEDKFASRKFKWGQLVAHLNVRYSTVPLPITLAMLATYVPFLAVNEGPEHALSTLATGGPLIWIGLWVVSRIFRNNVDRLAPWPRFAVILVIQALATLPFHLAYYLTFPVIGDTIWLPTQATLGTMVVGLVTGFSGAANNQLLLLKRQLESDAYRLKWRVAELKSRDWYLQQQFARKLHGPIQAELAAATIRIEQRISRGSVKPEAIAEIQEDLVAKLNLLLSTETQTPDLNAVLSEMRETWDGIAEIFFAIDSRTKKLLSRDAIATETALEIIREACSNAIRHGKATAIGIKIHGADPDSVSIEVSDNGAVHDGSGNPGLGTKYLNDCTIENGRQASASGSVLTAVIAVRA